MKAAILSLAAGVMGVLRPRALGAAALVWLAAWPFRAGAILTPVQRDYSVEGWQTDDGLPQSSVKSVVQTPDGYLWLATFGGLARFDGVRFTVLDTGNLPGLPSDRLIRLTVDRDGALWLITEYHELAWLKEGRCQVFTAKDGLPAHGVAWVDEDARGVLRVAGCKGGLWQRQNGKFVPLSVN